MKYRAKCTWIRDLVTKMYKLNHCHIVRDKFDSYIEVDTPEQAECVERMNKAEFERLQAEIDLLQLLDI